MSTNSTTDDNIFNIFISRYELRFPSKKNIWSCFFIVSIVFTYLEYFFFQSPNGSKNWKKKSHTLFVSRKNNIKKFGAHSKSVKFQSAWHTTKRPIPMYTWRRAVRTHSYLNSRFLSRISPFARGYADPPVRCERVMHIPRISERRLRRKSEEIERRKKKYEKKTEGRRLCRLE